MDDVVDRVDITLLLTLSIIKIKRSLMSTAMVFITDSGILCNSVDFSSQSAIFLFTFFRLSPVEFKHVYHEPQ